MIQREWLDRISYRILAGALLLFVTTFVTVPVRAQVLYGQLVGTVTDQSNSVVPNAVISIQETLTGQSHQETTDSGGRYSVVNLSPGTYSVRATAKGFKTIEQSAFTITPNTVNRLDFHLEIGEASQTVTVSAEALELQTDKADTHTELTSEGIVNMPLGGFRNYQALIDLVPGATPSTFQNSVTDTPGRALHTNINGANAQTNPRKLTELRASMCGFRTMSATWCPRKTWMLSTSRPARPMPIKGWPVLPPSPW